ncbi:hypothetical protein BACPEC_00099 [[Bacteroides] pectinophilus ATCC 43243]|uniref:Uncharacterized protein n=45 Tax=Bacillota TaxID=1239 RepID=B7AN47_9FIRM|nr:hypothetical protein BACPEC_00099 [[Bacteroides] pectinophilus ATCC 43243]
MHHDSDWNYVNRADQNRVPNLSRARFDYKRKDEDDMAKSTKTYEERIRALEKKEQESIEATKKLIAQRKELEKRKKAEESKKRTHRLCQIGGAVESVLGCPIEEEDLPKLIGFLKRQETNGKFFLKGDAERATYRYGGSVMAEGVVFPFPSLPLNEGRTYGQPEVVLISLPQVATGLRLRLPGSFRRRGFQPDLLMPQGALLRRGRSDSFTSAKPEEDAVGNQCRIRQKGGIVSWRYFTLQ